MKSLGITLLVLVLTAQLFAGGMVTNSNQSAEYMRTLNRNASLDIDAASVSRGTHSIHVYSHNKQIAGPSL